MLARCVLVLVALLPSTVLAQYSQPLSPSQLDELDSEGQLISASQFGRPPVDCPDIMDRVHRSHHGFLDKAGDTYLVLPNGDILNAYRALSIRVLEQRLQTLPPSARTRAERELNEFAPCGEIVVHYEDGSKSYDPGSANSAKESDTIYEYDNLPPLYELPLDPQPGTSASFPILGSRDDSPETLDFRVREQTDHWLIGHVEQDGRPVSQRIAVHRDGATLRLDRLERNCVLWPLNRTAENRRQYWSRSPIPLYVALDVDTIRATPAHIACAAEQGRVLLKNHTVRTEQTRTVTKKSESISGTHLANRSRTNGPWLRRVYWSSTPIQLRIVDHETHHRRTAERLARQDRAPREAPKPETPEITHILHLKDGRTLEGRLASKATDDEIEFVVIVGAIQQPMTFSRADIRSIEEAEPQADPR